MFTTCHESPVTCHLSLILIFFPMEGLLSTGPTPSSFYHSKYVYHDRRRRKKPRHICYLISLSNSLALTIFFPLSFKNKNRLMKSTKLRRTYQQSKLGFMEIGADFKLLLPNPVRVKIQSWILVDLCSVYLYYLPCSGWSLSL